MKRKIFICCIAHRYTGGPTLAHQLCYKLRSLGYEAFMYYYFCKNQNPVNANYKKYHLPYVDMIEDYSANIVITPETNVNLLRGVKHAMKIIWWMSVDNYFKSLKSKRNLFLDLGGIRRYNIHRDDVFHFGQSYYALDFLEKQGIRRDKIFYLSDYLERDFIEKALIPTVKKDIVLYNPKKGIEFTKKIISNSLDLKYVPLENLSSIQMLDRLRSAKVYIDFGNHPGKDRIPREAAISGCCIITGKKGSANYKEDVCIPDEFKFCDSIADIPQVVHLIRAILLNYEKYSHYFEDYRNRILNEENIFDKSVQDIFCSL